MKIIAGVDEVGRGSLIGPVVAAAVILKKTINKKLLKDSKRLSKSKRETLSRYIKKYLFINTKNIIKVNKNRRYKTGPPLDINSTKNMTIP